MSLGRFLWWLPVTPKVWRVEPSIADTLRTRPLLTLVSAIAVAAVVIYVPPPRDEKVGVLWKPYTLNQFLTLPTGSSKRKELSLVREIPSGPINFALAALTWQVVWRREIHISFARSCKYTSHDAGGRQHKGCSACRSRPSVTTLSSSSFYRYTRPHRHRRHHRHHHHQNTHPRPK